MAASPEPRALSFARQSIKEKISGPVHIYWKDIRKVLDLKNPVPVVLAPGCSYGHYVVHVNRHDFEIEGAIAEVLVHRGSSPDNLVAAFTAAVLQEISNDNR